MWWFVLPFLWGIGLGLFIGFCFGWSAGTRDTERRWADAVGRADDRRDRGLPTERRLSDDMREVNRRFVKDLVDAEDERYRKMDPR